MSNLDKAYAFIVERGELRAGKPGEGPAARLAGFLGVTPQRARMILLHSEEAGCITIEPPRDPHRRGPGRIERVAVTPRAAAAERDTTAPSPAGRAELAAAREAATGGVWDVRRDPAGGHELVSWWPGGDNTPGTPSAVVVAVFDADEQGRRNAVAVALAVNAVAGLLGALGRAEARAANAEAERDEAAGVLAEIRERGLL